MIETRTLPTNVGGGKRKQMEGKKNRYMKVADGIEADVKAGKLSKEDAERKLIELRKKMFPSGDNKKSKLENNKSKTGKDKEAAALKRRYEEGVKRIKTAIDSGKITEEQGEKRLDEMKKSLHGGQDK